MTDQQPAHHAVEELALLFAGEGRLDDLGDAVSASEHMLQTAALARAAGATDALVAAALLHDVGHFRGAGAGIAWDAGVDDQHGESGALWLARWFGPEVTEPVRLHTEAKRYLVTVEPGYLMTEASAETLKAQGGPMTEAQLAAYLRLPFALDAATLRRLDDRAKDPSATVPGFDHYRPLLLSLARN